MTKKDQKSVKSVNRTKFVFLNMIIRTCTQMTQNHIDDMVRCHRRYTAFLENSMQKIESAMPKSNFKQ